MAVIELAAQIVWLSVVTAEDNAMVLAAVTVMVPLVVMVPHPPVKVTVYGYVPAVVGAPLILTVLEAKLPATPVGKPVKVAPVAPVVTYVMAVIELDAQIVWLSVATADDNAMVFAGVTVMVPLVVMVPHPPVKVTVYGYVPAVVGAPLILTVLEAKLPATPVGKPVKVAPVAPVVA